MAIKFETVTSPPPKAAEKKPVEKTPAAEAVAPAKAPGKKLKSRNTLKKK